MAYSAGSIIGSTPIGFAMDILGPQALPLSIAAGFLALAIYLFIHKWKVPTNALADRS